MCRDHLRRFGRAWIEFGATLGRTLPATLPTRAFKYRTRRTKSRQPLCLTPRALRRSLSSGLRRRLLDGAAVERALRRSILGTSRSLTDCSRTVDSSPCNACGVVGKRRPCAARSGAGPFRRVAAPPAASPTASDRCLPDRGGVSARRSTIARLAYRLDERLGKSPWPRCRISHNRLGPTAAAVGVHSRVMSIDLSTSFGPSEHTRA
jgi:hypothetical protein